MNLVLRQAKVGIFQSFANISCHSAESPAPFRPFSAPEAGYFSLQSSSCRQSHA